MLKKVLLLFILQVNFIGLNGQSGLHSMIKDLREFVAIPNNGLNQKDIQKNIDWLAAALLQRDLQIRQLPTNGNPLLYAERQISRSLPTVLFYMHLDGQPVDPSKWNQEDPYEIVLKGKNQKTLDWEIIPWDQLTEEVNSEWRLFGRSAADDKAPIIAFLYALDQLKIQGYKPACNIKAIFDGEEEMGSPSLPAAVDQYKDLLAADVMIINDGPVHITGEPTLIFGCRGNMRVDLTVYGPVLPQHSGHFGNYAPNPIFGLSQLLASMKDVDGRVIIEGYYDGIHIGEEDKKTMNLVPDDPNQIKELLQIAQPEKVGDSYQESLQYPSLNARGILSGWVGNQARTIVPDNATVALDIRLVPENDPGHLIELIKKHMEKQGYFIVDHEPTKEERMTYRKIVYFNSGNATLAFRTSMSSKEGHWLSEALKAKFGRDPIKIRMMGGTVPIADFVSKMQIPAIIVPMVNADNNQHSPNENMRIGHLQNAREIFEAILTTPMKR
jgi:acetylornithine deacetylase/succinyl-diaminopimelate desuccinylase-like protein